MPTSKRSRILPTSKTTKNRKDLVHRLAANIQDLATTYRYIFVFDVQNMRNNFIKQVRSSFSDSRVVMGKTKVMMVALGRDASSETVPGVSKLGPYVSGDVGLLFTDRGVEEVQAAFAGFWNADYARSGAVAVREVRIRPGEVKTMYGVEGGEEDPLPLAIEPQLRKLGVPTRIKGGKVVLEEAPEHGMLDVDEEGYLVCKEGDTLDSRQTSILKILGVRMAEFRIELRAVYDRQEEGVQELGSTDIDGA
jgi:mRNA turnover protein 4